MMKRPPSSSTLANRHGALILDDNGTGLTAFDAHSLHHDDRPFLVLSLTAP
jgi:hypothetical protein